MAEQGWRLGGILSGGQTGADRAALDVALELGIPCGGWCPKGRLAEDGVIAARYPLRETASAEVAERTRRNVEDSDAILVLHLGWLDPGTQLAFDHTGAQGKSRLTVDLAADPDPAAARAWLESLPSGALVAIGGPRESNAPGLYACSVAFLRRLLGGLPFDDQLHQVARL